MLMQTPKGGFYMGKEGGVLNVSLVGSRWVAARLSRNVVK